MASLSRFSEVSQEELNTFIQNIIPEKRNDGLKNFKGKQNMNFNYQFDGFTRRIVTGGSSALFE